MVIRVSVEKKYPFNANIKLHLRNRYKNAFFVHCHFYHLLSLTRAGQKNRHPKENAYVRNLKTTKRKKNLLFFFFLQTLVC